ncbi:MAG: PQQ-like beta-propeller repeat protein [Planctomycetia bacterium]|nr:PQQ-like beta-propeller repeat protein [Planctomycetia bacterium]
MSVHSNEKSYLRRFWIPITLITVFAIAEAVNWTTNLVSEQLIPRFASSAQVVVGRNLVLLFGGLLLIWLLFTRQVSRKIKYYTFGILAIAAGLFAASIREIENTGNNNYVFHFRWEPTQEQRLQQYLLINKPGLGSNELVANAPTQTDFLGSQRDGVVPGSKLKFDLKQHAPKELWRRPVGGGYASCVLAGGLAVTIEQRGEEEMVVAYDLKTGQERWTRGYPGHFKESLGGNGPRATPTISNNEVFALGASGLLTCLDLASGQEKWKTNILEDASISNIQWGMSGAPLVVGNKVIVNPGGTNDFGVVAYDRATGKAVWHAGKNRASYASPVLAKLADVETVLIFDAEGVAGHELATGKELWRFAFGNTNKINVAQPLALPGDQVFVSAGYDAGAVMLQIKKDGGAWTATPIWQNKRLKCKMSSAVFHEGFLYGMDDGILACLDAKTGERKWKAGRYGHGQLLLRNDVLVIMGEAGDLVLVAADPKVHRELAKVPMLPGGKVWNAPALADDLLLLRNHYEAVLLQLATE